MRKPNSPAFRKGYFSFNLSLPADFWDFLLGLSMAFCPHLVQAQLVDPTTITIARDSFGVPHIFAPTDAAAAYGLAWATCEDHFPLVQEALMPARTLLSRHKKKEGLFMDFAMKFLGIDTLVAQRYALDLSPEFRKIVEAYVQGINDYARAHPYEVIEERLFPLHPHDIIASYVLSGSLMAGVGMALRALRNDQVPLYFEPNETGSNAVAVAPSRTEDSRTWLLINSHQPNEGRFAWYEAHVCSEEGTNILGALFPGGVTVFTGVNPFLGWAHTNNYHTLGDIYQLRGRGQRYLLDGQWLPFRIRRVRLHLLIGRTPIPFNRKLLYSVHGPVYKRKGRYYALRYPAYTDIRSAEQWWRMGKACELSSFEHAMRMDALPLFNVVYADRQGHILLHSAGRVPQRDTTIPWKQPLPGNQSCYIWQALLPFEKKTWILDPLCGYLYNANNTPAHYAHPECEIYKPPQWPGFQKFDYNRGDRYRELLAGLQGRFTLSHFLAIKFDNCYSFRGSYERNFGPLYRLDEQKYPRLAEAISLLKNWNRCGNMESEVAPLAMITHHFLSRRCRCPLALLMARPKPLTEQQCAKALQQAVRFMRRRYGTLRIPLGHIQRLMRDTVSLPVAGLREVPRAIHSTLVDRKKGLWKATGGDSYILVARFGQEGPEVWTVNTYGASGRPDSPHYTDQMRLFAEQRFKSMTLNKETILRNARRIYSPDARP